MKRDPLAVLWRVREAAVTEASRDLAAARAREMQQAERLDAYRQHIAQEQSEAVGEHVSGFADWLPHARLQRERLQAELQTAESHVRRLRTNFWWSAGSTPRQWGKPCNVNAAPPL